MTDKTTTVPAKGTTGSDAVDLDKLEALAKAATPQNFDSAQITNRGYIECPSCDGSGEVELTADYCNYDGRAIGVQFYGIGPEHRAAEAFYRAANPATVLALIAQARAAAPAAIPEGYKLVPLEPTPPMLEAARNAPMPAVWLDSIIASQDLATTAKYRAMLAAAPVITAPTATAEPVAVLIDALRNIRDYRTDVTAEVAAKAMRFYAELALSDRAAPAPQQAAPLTDEAIERAASTQEGEKNG